MASHNLRTPVKVRVGPLYPLMVSTPGSDLRFVFFKDFGHRFKGPLLAQSEVDFERRVRFAALAAAVRRKKTGLKLSCSRCGQHSFDPLA
jgi:hypothetical protein